MNKIFLALVFLALIPLAFSQGASDCVKPSESDILAPRWSFDSARMMVVEARMDAVIEVAESNDANTDELTALKDSAVEEFDSINFLEKSEYISSIQTIRDLMKEFRETARALPELNGKDSEVQAAISSNMEEIELDVEIAKELAKMQAKETALAVFDLHTCIAEARIETFSDANNYQDMLDQLSLIEGMRTDLEEALASGDRLEVMGVNSVIKDMWKDLRTLYKEARQARSNSFQNRINENAQNAINALQNAGIDTTEIETALNSANDYFDEVEDETESGNISNAITARNQLRTALQDLGQTIRNEFQNARQSRQGRNSQ